MDRIYIADLKDKESQLEIIHVVDRKFTQFEETLDGNATWRRVGRDGHWAGGETRICQGVNRKVGSDLLQGRTSEV